MAVAAQARPLNVDATIAELKALFGDRVSTAHAVREQHGKDISYHEAHLPDAVVFVESTEEVQQVGQLVQRSLLRLPLAALPEADKLLLQTTGRHKRGTPDKKPAIY